MKEKKRILIVCFHYSQHVRSLLHSFASYEDIQVDLLSSDLDTEYLRDDGLSKHERFCFNAYHRLKLPNVVKFIFAWLSLTRVFLGLKKYDIIELHYPNMLYVPLHMLYKLKASTLGICIWGDDFQHMPGNYRRVFHFFRKSYKYIITGNEGFIPRIHQAFGIPESNIHLIGFGSIVLQKLKERVTEAPLYRKKYGVGNRIVITCGHNAVEPQQHLKIIEALEATTLNEKEVLLIFPMTYPKDSYYISQVKCELAKSRFDYLLLENFMTDDEIIEYRLISDILIHIQRTDSFSAAMAEYFYSGNIVINGEWLKYPQLEKGHAYFLKARLDNLSAVIEDVVKNLSIHKTKTNRNVDLLWHLKSWESNSKLWYNVYRSQ